MSVNKNENEKSFEDFTSDLTEKTNLFFKSFKELTKDNLDNYLDFSNLLEIWNNKEEKEFLWKTFYKYNINGKVVESSVLKGLNEILSKEDRKSNAVSFNENNINYSRDDNVNIISLSYNKMLSMSLMKSNLNKDLESDRIKIQKDEKIEDLIKFIDSCDIKKIKAIKNIFILLNYNNMNKHSFLIKKSQIQSILDNYPLFNISIEDIIKYLSFISKKSLKSYKNDEEYNINEDSFHLSLELIENKIKELQNESNFNSINEISNLDNLNNEDIDNTDDSNKLEQKIKNYIEDISNIIDDLKICINILKDLDNSKKKCYNNIINDMKNLLTSNIFESSNDNIIKITDNDEDSKDELKMDIENNISFMNKKYEEVDMFLKDIENNLELKNKKVKNLNILLDILINEKMKLQNENNRLLKREKEKENYINNEFNKADEQISKLLDEKENLHNKINELIEKMEKMKLNIKYKNERINELENINDKQMKDINEKAKEINKLKLENKTHKNNYDSLVNDIIKINNEKEKQMKNYKKQLVQNALINISKKMKINFSKEYFNNCSLEQLLENFIKSDEKLVNNSKNLEEKEKLIIEKNKRINQIEADLELYREKTRKLSQENNDLKNKLSNASNVNINTEEKKNSYNLESLLASKSSINIESDKNNFTIFNKENQNILDNKNKVLSPTNSGDLFAPPCFTNNGENEENNLNIDNIKSDIMQNNKVFSNNSEANDNAKKYVNTPQEGFNNIKEEVNNDEIINSINIINRPSNPYINDLKDRKSNFDNERKENLFNLDKNDNLLSNSNENLNINEELDKNNESLEKNRLEIKNNNKQNINISLNQNVEKLLSLKDMEDILLKNYENKISTSSYDFLYLYTNPKIKEIFNKIGEDYNLTDIFSDIIYLLDKYEQLYKNIIFITKKCIYIMDPDLYKIKYTFVREILIKATLSSTNCNIIVFHFVTGNDVVLMTLRRPELISYFINTENNKINKKYDMKFRYADEFNVKKDGDYYTQKIKTSMNSTSFNYQTAIKLGYLIKINEGYIFNKYHEKLVVLTDFGLFYFDNPTVAPKKLIPIIGSEINDLKNKFGDKLFCFEIVTMNKYKIIFGSYCKENYEDWIEKLKTTKRKFENKNVFLG